MVSSNFLTASHVVVFFGLFHTGIQTVWIHDYHLLLVPHMLRQKLPGAAISVFIHAPWPSSEIFRCLPSKSFDPVLAIKGQEKKRGERLDPAKGLTTSGKQFPHGGSALTNPHQRMATRFLSCFMING